MRDNKWHKRFLSIATEVSSWSKDRSVGVGAVIVRDRRILSTGYNGFPRGTDDSIDERHTRPIKYWLTQHAECNAITNAARNGISIAGSTMYIHGRTCCASCAGAIDNAGIVTVVMNTVDVSLRREAAWYEQHEWAMTIFSEGGIEVITISN